MHGAMPYLNVSTNTEVSAEAAASFLQEASKAVAAGAGKPEQYVMVKISAGESLLFAGSNAPAAFVELKSIGFPTRVCRDWPVAHGFGGETSRRSERPNLHRLHGREGVDVGAKRCDLWLRVCFSFTRTSMPTQQTDADFEKLSWHDCNIWQIEFQVGDPENRERTNDLVLGIDFIAEWVVGGDQSMKFKVVPATLAFHGVTDPRIDVSWGETGFQVSIFEPSIGQIERELVENPKVFLDRLHYRWRIALNFPEGGEITFGAVGFTQKFLAEPVLCEKQHLSFTERHRLIGR